MDPVVFDLHKQEPLFILTSNNQKSSFFCISSSSNFVFCCDADKNVLRFDTDSEITYQIETRKNVKLNFSIYVIEFKIL